MKSIRKGIVMAGGMLNNQRGEPGSDVVDEARSAISLALPGLAIKIVQQIAIGCVCASLFSGLLLLLQDVAPSLAGLVKHSWLAAGALLFAGMACLGLASTLRARARVVIMRVLLASAFILWGIQQLLSDGAVSILLGDIVIVLFVIDFGAFLESSVATKDSNAA
jgi:hypothetical protein